MDDVQLQFNANDPSITYYQGWDAGTTSQPGAIAEISFHGKQRAMFLTTVSLTSRHRLIHHGFWDSPSAGQLFVFLYSR